MLNNEIEYDCYLESIDFFVATVGVLYFEARSYNTLDGFASAAARIDAHNNEPSFTVSYNFTQTFGTGYQRYYFPYYVSVPPKTIFYVKCVTSCLGVDIQYITPYTYDTIRPPTYSRMSAIANGFKAFYFRTYYQISILSTAVTTSKSVSYTAEGTYNIIGYYACNGVNVSSVVSISVSLTGVSMTTTTPAITTTQSPTGSTTGLTTGSTEMATPALGKKEILINIQV